MKVLYHINEESKWDMVIGNIKNMLAYGEENGVSFHIEVVANGKAVKGLLQLTNETSQLHLEMEQLHKEKVVFAACNNALKKFKSENLQICHFVSIVPAGVVEIAMKQQEGYSYIKP